MVTPDPAVEAVRATLVRLRTHAGLTADRLASTEVSVDVLAALPAVQLLADAGTPLADAVVQVVADQAGTLDPSTQLIADAALALGVTRARVGDHPAALALAADELATRREALVANWSTLHELLGVPTPPRPVTVRSLRGTREGQALGLLAERCLSAVGVPGGSGAGSVAGHGNVVVVGGAVMDHILLVDDIPAANTSTNMIDESVHPGGKGLNLAVAATRMGLRTRLIAAVGDDRYAGEVLAYLRQEELTTELVKQVPEANTAVTTVVVTPDGDSAVVGWRNAARLRRTRSELKRLRPELRAADAVLVTFEIPADEVVWALDSLSTPDRKPILLVQPSPPMDSPQRIYGLLSAVDVLVGSEWELRNLLQDNESTLSFDEITGQLLNLGVTAVCVVEQLFCRIRTRTLSADVAAPPAPLAEKPGAREAFSAALTCQLLKIGRDLTRQKLEWAAAAMTATISLDEIPESMPAAEDVDMLLTLKAKPE